MTESQYSFKVRKNLWRPRVKLLTEDEYREQSNIETRKALEELRRYCQSPSSNPWKTVTKVRNPSRFAEFVDGSPHLTEEEVMTYSTWSSDDEDRRYTDLPDDLFEEMTDDEEVVVELGHRFWCPLCVPLQPGHRDQCTEDEESDEGSEGH